MDYFKSKVLQMFSDNTKPGWILGQKFVLSRAEEQDSFKEYWKNILWFSYRSDFPPIEPTPYTSDVGWGCTLRTAQMLLSNAFLQHFVGIDWISKAQNPLVSEQILKIIKWFSDHPTAPYSIHAIATGGLKFNKEIGAWHGPNTVSRIIKDLVESHAPDHNSIGIYVSSDGVIYRDQLFQGSHKSQIILIPLRLGIHVFNKSYIPSLQILFSIPNFLGIIGGRPSSSYFFIGFHEDNLFYLDPHTNQPYVDFTPETPEDLIKENVRASILSLTSTYHAPDIGRMSMSSLDPSLTLGFYCKDIAAFDILEALIEQVLPRSHDLPAIFSFEDIAPDYDDGTKHEIISFAEDDF